MLGIAAEDILRISAKTGEGVAELLDAVVERIPPPTGDPDAPLQALIFDSQFDQYRGVVSSIRVMNGRHQRRLQAAVHAGRRPPRGHRDRRPPPGPDAGARARPGRGRLPHRRHQGRRRGPLRRDRHHGRRTAPTTPLPGYRDPKPMVFCGLFPIDGDDFEDLRELAGEAEAQRRVDHLRAGVVGGARLRVPLRLPRPAAHGDRQGAPRARVRPRPHRHRAERRVPGAPHRRRRSSSSTTPPTCPSRRRSTTSRSRTSGSASSRRRTTRAR